MGVSTVNRLGEHGPTDAAYDHPMPTNLEIAVHA